MPLTSNTCIALDRRGDGQAFNRVKSGSANRTEKTAGHRIHCDEEQARPISLAREMSSDSNVRVLPAAADMTIMLALVISKAESL
jgi:hypothetical protein